MTGQQAKFKIPKENSETVTKISFMIVEVMNKHAEFTAGVNKIAKQLSSKNNI